MPLHLSTRRNVAAGLLLATALLALAPAAQAEGRGRYKVVSHGWQGSRARVVLRERDGGPGPVLAGLVGGFLLGTAFAHPQPVVVHESVSRTPPVAWRDGWDRADGRYVYYDPYCDRTFDSLEDARWHETSYHHPRVIRVIEAGSGACVRTLHLYDGRWIDDEVRDD